MKENHAKYIEVFKVFEILLIGGIIDTNYVNSWSDNILSKENESEYEFIELSTTTNINDLIVLLKRLSSNCNLKISQRAVFGTLYNSTLKDFPNIKLATRIVDRFVYENELSQIEKNFLAGINDFVELAISGIYGDIDKFKNEFWDFLEIYQTLNFTNYENWITINNKIEQNLEENLKKIQDKYSIR